MSPISCNVTGIGEASSSIELVVDDSEDVRSEGIGVEECTEVIEDMM